MNTEFTIAEIVKLVKEHPEQKVMFDTAVSVKASPHHHICDIWGACVSPGDVLWLMTYDQKWYDLHSKDVRADMVANSILQRLKALKAGIRV